MPSGVSVTINRKYVQNYNQGVGLQLLSKTVYLPALMCITAALYDNRISFRKVVNPGTFDQHSVDW